MNENTKIWNALAKTDPAHTKKFTRAGGFRGTAVKPIYMDRQMTEQFGPCGKGWGMSQPKFDVVQADSRTLVYCTVAVWWENPEQKVYGVGGDVVRGENRSGPVYDDEAFKKAYTDALSNAMKHLGMAADIHMGLHDDDKYVAELNKQFTANGTGEQGSGNPPAVPDDGAGPPKDSRDPNWQGPLNKTKLKAELENLFERIGNATFEEELVGIVEDEFAQIIKQAKHDMPGWITGEDEPVEDGFEPLKRRYTAKLRFLRGVQQQQEGKAA